MHFNIGLVQDQAILDLHTS